MAAASEFRVSNSTLTVISNLGYRLREEGGASFTGLARNLVIRQTLKNPQTIHWKPLGSFAKLRQTNPIVIRRLRVTTSFQLSFNQNKPLTRIRPSNHISHALCLNQKIILLASKPSTDKVRAVFQLVAVKSNRSQSSENPKQSKGWGIQGMEPLTKGNTVMVGGAEGRRAKWPETFVHILRHTCVRTTSNIVKLN